MNLFVITLLLVKQLELKNLLQSLDVNIRKAEETQLKGNRLVEGHLHEKNTSIMKITFN